MRKNIQIHLRNSFINKMAMAIILWIAFIANNKLLAQDYVPFDFTKGNVWENHEIPSVNGPPVCYSYLFRTIGTDTLLLGKEYHVLKYTSNGYNQKGEIYLREDTLNKKLYFFNKVERLLLDFNVYSGDSMIIGCRDGLIKIKITKKEKVFVAGKYRNKYFIEREKYIKIKFIEFYYDGGIKPWVNTSRFENNYLIEGIGTNVGINTLVSYVLTERDPNNKLRCYNTETIVDTGFPCTSILGTADNQEASKVVTLYPNPVQNILNIKSEFMFNALSVYDTQGTKVLESKATVNLDVSALPEGLYLLEAWDMEGRRVLKKFEKR